MKFVSMVHLYHMNEHKEFHTYRMKPIGNKNRASWAKIENFTFSDFHDFFFTPIYAADFCEFFFLGSPTPYERTQGVSHLQMSVIGACARSYELSDMHFISATRLIEAFSP